MKRISYAGGSLLTGDGIADALLDYATVLARAGTADRIDVPVVDVADGRITVDIVVGPASQLLAEHVEGQIEELHDEAFVADLRHRSRLVKAGRVEKLGLASEQDGAT